MCTGWHVSAVVNNGYVNLAVVSLHAEQEFKTELKGVPAGQEIEVHLATSENLDDVNTTERMTVGEQVEGGRQVLLPQISFTLLR